MQNQKMMGFETAGDKRVSVTVRDWQAMQLAVWRSRVGFEAVILAATAIIANCKHADGCPGASDDTEPCLSDRYTTLIEGETSSVLVSHGCPDREIRMSALVALNAARTLAPIDARRPAGEPYMAPGRERYSETIAELGATQIELDRLRAILAEHKIDVPAPPPNLEPVVLKIAKPKFSPDDFGEEDTVTEEEESAS